MRRAPAGASVVNVPLEPMTVSVHPPPPASSTDRADLRVLQIGSGTLFGEIEVCQRTLAMHRDAAPGMHQEYAYCSSGKPADEIRATGAPTHLLGGVRYSRPWTVLAARRALSRLLRDHAYDVVICHEVWVFGLFASTIRKAGRPLVLWIHDRHGAGGFLERLARRTPPDQVIANSRWSVEGFDRFMPTVPYRVLYCPVELDDPSARLTRNDLRHKFEAAEGDVVILQVGRWVPHDGHLGHLDALATLRGVSGWVCWQVGAPQHPAEQAYFEQVKVHAEALGIATRIRFLGWQPDLAGVRAAADVYCQPNIDPEPFGSTVVEALSAGLPVIASAEAGALEIVTPSCGVLVPPRRTPDLAAALRRLLGDPSERRRLGDNGPRRARELCEPGQQVRRLAELLRAHLAAKARKSA
jgi:glycosyltransferase involved in cell wall biosynthesis